MFNKLVEKARQGDVQATEEIIERLQPLLISSIRKYYNRPKEYDDLIQDGNMKILESIRDYDREKGVYFLGYIKTNIRYLYLDKHKEKIHQSLNQRIGHGETEIMDLLVGEELNLLGDIIEKENNLELKKALSILTPRQRQVIKLFYEEDMSIGDIGVKLGVAYRTVVNTKTRALEKMENYLIKRQQ